MNVVLLQTKKINNMALHLYYDSKKGLVKSNNYAVGCYITEHDEKGIKCPLHEQTLEIPERNVKNIVRTNLHYGSKSYMNARITMMDKYVFNFLDNSLLHSVDIIFANPGDWDMLFDRIINVYDSIFCSENNVNSYFDAIDEAVKGEKSQKGNELNNAIVRMSEIADKQSFSIYCDNTVLNDRMKNSCRLLIKRIMGLKIPDDSKPWEKELRSVFNYLAEREEIGSTLSEL